ncbi:MAG TPA: hypothetical protein PKN76_07500 [bacterium]|nr:hypothetical protein [bacterium]HPY15851.1 hypothetical protein [bacterium]
MRNLLMLLISFFVFYAGCSKDSYIGNLEKGVRDGYGVINYSDESKYEGHWKNNKKHGTGVFTYENGAKYEGNFENDKKNGVGKFFWPNGDIFEGAFKDDNFLEGKMSFKNGTICSGKFSGEALMDGEGKCTTIDGDTTEGIFKDGKLNGIGKITLFQGLFIMEGNFKNDEMDGEARLIIADIGELKAVWKNGNIVNPIDKNDFKENLSKIEWWKNQKIREMMLEDSVGTGYKMEHDEKDGRMIAISEDSEKHIKVEYTKEGLRKYKTIVLKKTGEEEKYLWIQKRKSLSFFPFIGTGFWKKE